MKLELPLLLLSSAASVQAQFFNLALWCAERNAGCSYLMARPVYPTYDCGVGRFSYYNSNTKRWELQVWEAFKDKGAYHRCCEAQGRRGCEGRGPLMAPDDGEEPEEGEVPEEGEDPEGEEVNEDETEEAEGENQGGEAPAQPEEGEETESSSRLRRTKARALRV